MPEEIKEQALVDNTSVEEVEQELEEVVETQEEQVEELVADPVIPDVRQSEKEENLKALRASRKQLQIERDEYLKRIQALEAQQKAAVLPRKDLDFDDDEFDENKKEIRLLKQQYADMAVNNSRMKLYTEYPDFAKVVTQESIAILQQRFPEIAATLNQGRDTYSTGVSAYNIIKKFGLHVDEETTNNREHVETNINKPRPVSSLKSSSALANAGDYSDLSDKQVRAEIIRIATERAANG